MSINRDYAPTLGHSYENRTFHRSFSAKTKALGHRSNSTLGFSHTMFVSAQFPPSMDVVFYIGNVHAKRYKWKQDKYKTI